MGCSKKQLVFDTRFSINLARPGDDFCSEEVTAAQEEVLEKYGTPDFIRVYWDKQGEFVGYLQADLRLREKEHRDLKQTWIYIDNLQEIEFVDEENYSISTLSEKGKIVCELGDPDQVQKHSDNKGGIEEVWTYYGKGWIFRFYNSELISKRRFQPMGSYIKK
jgi:hypothetical protein